MASIASGGNLSGAAAAKAADGLRAGGGVGAEMAGGRLLQLARISAIATASGLA